MRRARKLMHWMMMLPAMLLAAGCVTTNSGNYCQIAQPIWWDSRADLDATPTGIVRQVLAHNEVWERVCGR